jgi:hypothetical protein
VVTTVNTVFVMFDFHLSDYFPTQNFICWCLSCPTFDVLSTAQLSSGTAVFCASKVVPVHNVKACQGGHVSCVLNIGYGCRRCLALNNLIVVYLRFRRMLSAFYPEG